MLKQIERQTKKQKQKFEYSNQDAIKKMKFKWKDKEKIATKKKYIFNLHFFNYIHKFTFEKLPKLKQQKIKNLKS